MLPIINKHIVFTKDGEQHKGKVVNYKFDKQHNLHVIVKYNGKLHQFPISFKWTYHKSPNSLAPFLKLIDSMYDLYNNYNMIEDDIHNKFDNIENYEFEQKMDELDKVMKINRINKTMIGGLTILDKAKFVVNTLRKSFGKSIHFYYNKDYLHIFHNKDPFDRINLDLRYFKMYNQKTIDYSFFTPLYLELLKFKDNPIKDEVESILMNEFITVINVDYEFVYYMISKLMTIWMNDPVIHKSILRIKVLLNNEKMKERYPVIVLYSDYNIEHYYKMIKTLNKYLQFDVKRNIFGMSIANKNIPKYMIKWNELIYYNCSRDILKMLHNDKKLQ